MKPPERLALAYDDPLGVTAAFNLNLLVRMNRELGATFRVEAFAHRATWSPSERRVEMHLVSLARQTADIPGADCRVDLVEGETIWTESSYKYRPGELGSLGARAGFTLRRQWIDEPGQFALSLFEAG